jgi:cation diffusion facilitator family transporter
VDACCREEDIRAAAERAGQRATLQIVLAVNAALFLAETATGWLAGSTALLGDSLDMLGDSLVYGFSLYVLAGSERDRARAALLKGIIMLAFGASVLGGAVWRMLSGSGPPVVEAMGLMGLVALLGNLGCFALLWRHRSGDLNMRSAWLCSRNDLVSNSAVLVAAAVVGVTASAWPDLLVGVGIAFLFLHSAIGVLRESAARLRQREPVPEGGRAVESREEAETRSSSLDPGAEQAVLLETGAQDLLGRSRP